MNFSGDDCSIILRSVVLNFNPVSADNVAEGPPLPLAFAMGAYSHPIRLLDIMDLHILVVADLQASCSCHVQ